MPDLLDAARGDLLPPIRAEVYGPDRLARQGRTLAMRHRARRGGVWSSTFFPRLRSNIDMLRLAQRHIAAPTHEGENISPAGEWLLDNFHLIDAQLLQIHEGLPRRYFRSLPVLREEPLAGLPRIYGVAWDFVAHTDGAFDEDLLVQFLRAYQARRELQLAEMWALPTTLRVVLVENLRRLAEREAAFKAARDLANATGDRIETLTPPDLDALLVPLRLRGVARTFLCQLAQRLQGRPRLTDDGSPDRWLAWLARALPDAATAQAQQDVDQTADNLSVSNAVTSLQAIGAAEWTDIIARTSALVRQMLGSHTFSAEDEGTRSQTLHELERLARRSHRSERAVARTLLGLMQAAGGPGEASTRTVAGHWLQGPGRATLLLALGLRVGLAGVAPSLQQSGRMGLYLALLAAGTAWLTLGLTPASGDVWSALAAMLLVAPASEAVLALMHRLVSESTRPRRLPRLALSGGIPAEHRVLVVIPALLGSADGADALVHRLHLHHLANPEAQAQFALLTDGVDAASATLPRDADLLTRVQSGLAALNARHPPGPDTAPRFVLLHRERRWSATERAWIGWERKRGKLEQLLAALATGHSNAFVDLGRASQLASGVRHLLTLDSDTGLPPGRLRELVGVAAHPLNQPRLAPDGRRVVSGFGILQPRLATPLPERGHGTAFHALFAGQCGIDPYSAASSEVYQDLFGEGSFSGKGLLDVRAMHRVLDGRLPEGRVLSHDLLEGSLLRCAVVGDVTLVEDAPFHADVAASRVTRWMRGDWQLLPFLLRPRRWPLGAVNRWKMIDNLRRSLVAPASLALLLLALAGRGPSPGAALALVLAAFGAGPLLGAVAALSPSRDDLSLRHFYRAAGLDLLRAVGGALWHVAQLLQRARAALGAIGRALWRQAVSHRHLLQWSTAASAQAQARTALVPLLRQHRAEPAIALTLLAALLAAGTPHPLWAVLLCGVWAASPLLTWWASRPRPLRGEAALSPREQAALEAFARDAWRCFERTVVPADLDLPPDNLQTNPHDMVAHRTSPTNIGLYLLSAACARQFGWIDTDDLVRRLRATLATLATLERHRGHWLNWYDTQSGAALLPRYVSTVDSGNLAGHLLAVAQACRERAALPDEARQAGALLALARQCEQLAWQPDFRFLYNRKRHLLHIGWRVAEQQLDDGLYDLMASESRLTSLLAIAKGDVPVRHWAALGRPYYVVGALAALRSWSGSMFEYLMPGLVLAEPPGSALHEACRAALREHVNHGREHGVPWGLSESAYAVRDASLAYQYAPQGVPRLALRRTPPGELVVAPYATALAAMLAPRLALANFGALAELGARGAYGCIEALDFSPARVPAGERCVRVETYMAHHLGMSIVALTNVLLGGAARRWGMADPHIEAVASLLHERAPREVSSLHAPLAGPPAPATPRHGTGAQRLVLPGAGALEPTHLLGNGRYTVALRANGAGFSRLGSQGLTRWRDDALRDACGHFVFLRWDRHPHPVSATLHPAPDAHAVYRSVFHADRVCFDASWPDLHVRTTVWVSPEDDIEFREVELRNVGERALGMDVLSAFEPTLAEDRADEAHPAFGQLFMRSEWLPAQQALMSTRQPRLAGEAGLHMAHFLADADPAVTTLRGQTDRQAWRGRNHDASQPRAVVRVLAAGAQDTGLDPVSVLSVPLHIAAGGKARLTFATAAHVDPATLHAVIDKHRQASGVQRASLMSATLAAVRARDLHLGAESLAAVQTLSTALMLSVDTQDPGTATDLPGVVDRRLLWRFGLSGDRPLLVVSVGALQGLPMLRTLAQALRLWAWAGVACDLVLLDGEAASYAMAVQHALVALREAHDATRPALTRPDCTGLFVLRGADLSVDETATLQALARVWFHADGRTLAQHVQAWTDRHEGARDTRQETSTTAVPVATTPEEPDRAQADFDVDSGDVHFEVGRLLRPARPWINVLANPGFGSQVSEAGGGFTWAVNSRLHQLTAWSNDPVADPPCEWLLLQDLRTRQSWSLTPSAWGAGDTRYRVSQGQGRTVISHRHGDLDVRASWCVDPLLAIKQVRVQVVNRGNATRTLRLLGVAEWMLGERRSDRRTVMTALHRQRLGATVDGDAAPRKLTALLATQLDRAGGFGAATAFLAVVDAADQAEDWTCDRRECFDARGRLVVPDHFGQRAGRGNDPCAALAVAWTLAAGETAERCFLLGHAATSEAARELAVRAAAVAPAQREAAARAPWDDLLGATTVRTPDPLFDSLVNHWLLYQAVSSRLWAKAGFYQAGGATGFRDQLQDMLALAWAAPDLLRAQIVLAASRQFEPGDVQHWWHAPGGAGIRSHSSDDLLWLPHACLHHLRTSGDSSLLDERVPFLEGPAVPEGAEDLYETPTVSAADATVYEHAARAIDRSLRVGAHGLPLMGTGDWNDGMNRVGHGGQGESVWLAWFLVPLVAGFAPLARARGDTERADTWERASAGWQAALQGPGWDGRWYRRAFFDDGQPLGSADNAEGRIDLIAQAWAVLSDAAPAVRQEQALAAVEGLLVDHDHGLLPLLTPPLVHAVPSAGYIQAYPAGVRENGGQYSHGAVWLLMAQAAIAVRDQPVGHDDRVWRDFTWLSPAHRSAHPTQGPLYGLEPYVMAGDVCTQAPWTGRGGWSWYTGAAAWMHRAAIESIFGLRLEGPRLCLRPCLPSHWPEAGLTLRRAGRTLQFTLLRVDARQASELAVARSAVLLLPGAWLDWTLRPGLTRYVLPLE